MVVQEVDDSLDVATLTLKGLATVRKPQVSGSLAPAFKSDRAKVRHRCARTAVFYGTCAEGGGSASGKSLLRLLLAQSADGGSEAHERTATALHSQPLSLRLRWMTANCLHGRLHGLHFH